MAPELLDEDRHLHRAEPEPALGFSDLDAEPTLLDHRGPEGPVERIAGGRVRPDPGR